MMQGGRLDKMVNGKHYRMMQKKVILQVEVTNALQAEFVWTKPYLRAAAGNIRLKCFHLMGKQ
jgi:hypothetical protein